MRKQIDNFFKAKKIAILGFGREGKSSLTLLRKLKSDHQVNIYDERVISRSGLDKTINTFEEVNFSKIDFSSYDVLLKSPGVPFLKFKKKFYSKIESQTSLFLNWYGNQTIGITGTKGKSTTTSLCHHLLKEAGMKVLLGGNIGTPLFDLIPKINKNSLVVAELSCHQLFKIKYSPRIAVLLNLYEEHLDYYKDADEYFRSKLNIYLHQKEDGHLISNQDDSRLKDYLNEQDPIHSLSYSLKSKKADFYVNASGELVTELFRGKAKKIECKLLGKINYYNIMPALAVGQLCGIAKTSLFESLKKFEPLPHRLEYIGRFNGIDFVNDSISTIPQASIAAVEALEKVDTLILGGFDRGIDYTPIEDYLLKHKISNLIFFDASGKRMYENILSKKEDFDQLRNTLVTNDFEACIQFCLEHTAKGKICLLSPASSSYGIFKNFEDRGERFKETLIRFTKPPKNISK